LQVQPTAAAFLFPVILLQATLLALGIGMMLGSFALRYRDIPHIWSVILQVLFWLTPIMYAYRPKLTLTEDAIRLLSGDMQPSLWALFDIFIRFQPLSILLYDARRILLYADASGIPSLMHFVVFTLILGAVFLAGMSLFKYRSRYFLQEY
jgi:ABC-type polysaccharide/polyol phosphate export permease